VTVTVNTGGFSEDALEAVAQRSAALGAAEHVTVDARKDLFDDHLSFLIKGNVLRGDVYPLCVGPERIVQARHVVSVARQRGARAVAHGSTGAGNDQVRFDVAVRLLAGDLDIITPIRDEGLSRADTTAFLQQRGFDVPARTTRYSINAGLWGTTIGGEETLGTALPLPDDAFPGTQPSAKAPDEAEIIEIGFKNGLPNCLGSVDMDPVALVEMLNDLGGRHGVGRGIHVGDTIMGIKGRVGFEAPAAIILITAHRELEKVVLTRWQRYQKDHLADFYGMLLHEGQYFDPVMRDLEAFMDSSQFRVTGDVRAKLFKGSVSVTGCDSRFSMFDAAVATYGETNELWDGRDARGFAQITGVQAYLASRAGSSLS